MSEEKKEPPASKRLVAKELKSVEKKEKEIPRTLERRESKSIDRKDVAQKSMEKKEARVIVDKKLKGTEEARKPAKKEKKGKDSDKEEEESDGYVLII